MRNRLTSALRELNIISGSTHVNQLVADPNSPVAFASLIRCSVSRLNEKKFAANGEEVYACSGPLIKKSFQEIPEVMFTCANRFLRMLPHSLSLIVLLGTGSVYMRKSQELIASLSLDSSWLHLGVDYAGRNQTINYANR